MAGGASYPSLFKSYRILLNSKLLRQGLIWLQALFPSDNISSSRTRWVGHEARQPGRLYLDVKRLPDPLYPTDGCEAMTDISITPCEAVLSAKVMHLEWFVMC